METTIKRKLKGLKMEAIFEAQHEKLMIKYYEALNIDSDANYKRANVYNFRITVRHPEGTNAETLFDEALNKLFPAKKMTTKKKIFFVSTEKKRKRGKISFYISEIVPNKGLRLIDNNFTCSEVSHRGTETEAINRLVELKELPKKTISKSGYISQEERNFILIMANGQDLVYINQLNN